LQNAATIFLYAAHHAFWTSEDQRPHELLQRQMFGAWKSKRAITAQAMNCPGHILIINKSSAAYRELPVRLAELGTVYRYERSGVLHGLLRVRGFTQDDAHIFCMPSQIESEVDSGAWILPRGHEEFSGFDKFEVSFRLGSSTRKITLGGPKIGNMPQMLSPHDARMNIPYKRIEGEGASTAENRRKANRRHRAAPGSSPPCNRSISPRASLQYVGKTARSISL